MKERWVVAYIAHGMVNADIIIGRLQTERIPTRVKYEAAGRIYAITLNGLGEVKVLVPEDYLGRAKEVLADTFSDDELPWNGQD